MLRRTSGAATSRRRKCRALRFSDSIRDPFRWPGPGVIRRQKDEFVQNLKRLKVDAVISGNGGCGLCTPKEMGSCIAAEHEGLPSVMIAAPGFAEQAKLAARTGGVPVPRVAVYPGAFSAHSREELLKNTREILWPQIVAALTEKFTEAELKQAEDPADGFEVVYSGNLDEVNLFFPRTGGRTVCRSFLRHPHG